MPNNRRLGAQAKPIPVLGGLYALALLLGLCSVVLAAARQPLAFTPLGVGVIITTFVGRGCFAKKWAPICFLLLAPMAVAVGVLLVAAR